MAMNKIPFILLIVAILLASCAQESQTILVPVYDAKMDLSAQKQKCISSLIQSFPELGQREIQALREIPREQFIAKSALHRAYEDRPLPIGNGQTTLKLSEVAFLLSELKIQPEDIVFEVGTGTGYFTAILSRLAKTIYTVEINEFLRDLAYAYFHDNDIENVVIRVKTSLNNGLKGWYQKNILFDVVIISASIEEIPKDIIDQLKSGARVAAPIRQKGQTQWIVYRRDENETLTPIGTHEAVLSEAIMP